MINAEQKYELIDFTIDIQYEADCEPVFVSDDGPDTSTEGIVYDDKGIPMGNSLHEIEIRESKIVDFLHTWSEHTPERKVHNIALDDDIFVRGISVIEAREHSSKTYKSTLAIFILNEVLQNAMPVGRVPVKKNNKNQSQFTYMLIMVYRHPEIGTIKLTVGVRASEQRIQYGLTTLNPGQPLIDKSVNRKNKKRSSR